MTARPAKPARAPKSAVYHKRTNTVYVPKPKHTIAYNISTGQASYLSPSTPVEGYSDAFVPVLCTTCFNTPPEEYRRHAAVDQHGHYLIGTAAIYSNSDEPYNKDNYNVTVKGDLDTDGLHNYHLSYDNACYFQHLRPGVVQLQHFPGTIGHCLVYWHVHVPSSIAVNALVQITGDRGDMVWRYIRKYIYGFSWSTLNVGDNDIVLELSAVFLPARMGCFATTIPDGQVKRYLLKYHCTPNQSVVVQASLGTDNPHTTGNQHAFCKQLAKYFKDIVQFYKLLYINKGQTMLEKYIADGKVMFTNINGIEMDDSDVTIPIARLSAALSETVNKLDSVGTLITETTAHIFRDTQTDEPPDKRIVASDAILQATLRTGDKAADHEPDAGEEPEACEGHEPEAGKAKEPDVLCSTSKEPESAPLQHSSSSAPQCSAASEESPSASSAPQCSVTSDERVQDVSELTTQTTENKTESVSRTVPKGNCTAVAQTSPVISKSVPQVLRPSAPQPPPATSSQRNDRVLTDISYSPVSKVNMTQQQSIPVDEINNYIMSYLNKHAEEQRIRDEYETQRRDISQIKADMEKLQQVLPTLQASLQQTQAQAMTNAKSATNSQAMNDQFTQAAITDVSHGNKQTKHPLSYEQALDAIYNLDITLPLNTVLLLKEAKTAKGPKLLKASISRKRHSQEDSEEEDEEEEEEDEDAQDHGSLHKKKKLKASLQPKVDPLCSLLKQIQDKKELFKKMK